MRLAICVVITTILSTQLVRAQTTRTPRFEDYPASEIFREKPAAPLLTRPEEYKFRVVIGQGVEKGWGVFEGTTRKELAGPGPNFAGHYILVSFGCGSPILTDCLMTAIVDAETGRVYPLPSDEGSGLPYFGVFSEFAIQHPTRSFHGDKGGRFAQYESPFSYRLNSRLLIARVCERLEIEGGSVINSVPKGCGDHFYTMDEDGLKLVYRVSNDGRTAPRFEDYPVNEIFNGAPAAPVVLSPEERRYRTVIRQGVTKGWGVEGPDGKERPGPNFAGHYFIITWGCGSPCLMAAVVDARNGGVYPPPFHHGRAYFQVPWADSSTPPLDYRLDSRLLIANVCEQGTRLHVGDQINHEERRCGPHYFLMEDSGLTLIYRVLE
ncbi:MAG: hypothetical protein ABSB35_25115 [Bryobacteraceae bacterium]